MNIPNLPTDSLYKFLALAGLSFVLISTYMTYSVLSSKNQETVKFNGELSIHNYESENLNLDMKFIKQKLRKLCAVCNCNCFDKNGDIQLLPNVSNYGDKQLTRERQQIDSLLTNYRDKLHQLNVKTLQINAKNDLLADSEESAHAFMIIFFILIGLGILMTFSGFSLWYKKIQIYQDQILKNEASKYIDNKTDEKVTKQMD